MAGTSYEVADDQGSGWARVRPLRREDRARIASLLATLERRADADWVGVDHARVFTAAEVSTALELIDEWVKSGERSGYLTHVVEDLGEAGETVVQGYMCYGPTPMTDTTYDLYWIAVDPSAHGRGYGRRLLAFAEVDIGRRGGRLVLIETSSHDGNKSAIRFYEKAGYDLVARVPNFYRAGDDKLVFAKELASGGGMLPRGS